MSVYARMKRRAVLACGLSLVGLAPLAHADQGDGAPKTAPELLAKLSTLSGLEATFVETKQLALLRMPLRSEGTLYYMRPGHLLREVNHPKSSRVLITPDRLELRDEQGVRTMDLRSRPDVKLFVEAFIKVLAGDHAALVKVFDIQFAPAALASGQAPAPETSGWVLTLTPNAPPLNQLVRKLTLKGSGYAVDRIEVLETKGDSSITELKVKAVNRIFTDQEKQTLFGIVPPPPGN